jgi:very-short-patch-repair endonuclease
MGSYEVFGRYVDRCESPLERRFLVALLFTEWFDFAPVSGRGPSQIAEDSCGVVLGQQVRVGAYRIDFAMKRRGSSKKLAIEIDGKTFHSSPEQVERDKIRDRVLVAQGWSTMRYCGRELLRDALTCARQAHEVAARSPLEQGEMRPALARAEMPKQLALPERASVARVAR